VGIRPLFLTHMNGRLAFASEVKALFALPDVPRQLDMQALGEIFTTWAPLPPHAAFAGVHSLGPGECMAVDAQGSRTWRYWDWSFPTETTEPYASADEAAEALRELLVDCVRLQLRADVPVGAYLSGGLDSSVITTLIHHHTSTPLRTFSLTFDDAEFDESAEQRLLVQHLGCEHSTLRCSRADIAAAFPQAVFHAESPILRTAPAPLMLLAEHVRASGYKVVLTGEGADEVSAVTTCSKRRACAASWRGSRSPPGAVRCWTGSIPICSTLPPLAAPWHNVFSPTAPSIWENPASAICRAGPRRNAPGSSSRQPCANNCATGTRYTPLPRKYHRRSRHGSPCSRTNTWKPTPS
jgi:Asparagine synthase (glutamine-hydrolyzing)